MNPRDDREIAAAMRSLLTDDELLARLTAETRGVDADTWDDYAERVWQYLMHAVAPDVPLTEAAPRPAVAIDGSA